jgi:hypothetical protein
MPMLAILRLIGRKLDGSLSMEEGRKNDKITLHGSIILETFDCFEMCELL